MTGDTGKEDTLLDSGAATTPTEAALTLTPGGTGDRRPLAVAGYDVGEVIGRGGMGEVLLARDRRIGRDVAIKRMLTADASADALARFLREAQIQARLDHPAIVPVHELGHDAEGRPYFTMKRLAGTTMQELLGQNDAQLQRLLRAFVDVCLAIDLAHAKGVIHRDLKPSNIMLGDYGEVYVLDWGVARVTGDASAAPGEAAIVTLDGVTQSGAILGTPGYMAPEQALGTDVGPPADVYALGCILFEILAHEPLHPRGEGALGSTLGNNVEPPGRRRPERGIAPELDEACTDALASDPAARPTARALAERVQRYLDGDRDLERRRGLATAQLERAHTALVTGDRAVAMQAAGRALALDPESTAAATLVTRLMLEPPRDPPPGLRTELTAADATVVRDHARTSAWSYPVIIGCTPVLIWNGVESWPLVGAIIAVTLALTLGAWRIVQQPARDLRGMVPYLVGDVLLVTLVARLCGPLIITPTVACMMIMSAVAYPPVAGRTVLIVGGAIAGWLLPVGLEQAGILGSTWSVVDDAVLGGSHAIHLGGLPTIVLVFGGSLITIAIAGVHAAALSRANIDAQHKLVAQAWHLRQLLPTQAATDAGRDQIATG